MRKLFGENHVRLTVHDEQPGDLVGAKGDYDGGEALHRQALALRRKQFGETHHGRPRAIRNLADLFYAKGQYCRSRTAAAASARRLSKVAPAGALDDSIAARSHLGACLTKLKRYREAEEQLLPAYAGLKAARGAPARTLTRKAVSRLIELYEAWGKPDQAAPYRALPQAQEKR